MAGLLQSHDTITLRVQAFVVEETKIEYNKTELLQLIYMHLAKEGLLGTASKLLEEATLPPIPASLIADTPKRIDRLVTMLARAGGMLIYLAAHRHPNEFIAVGCQSTCL